MAKPAFRQYDAFLAEIKEHVRRVAGKWPQDQLNDGETDRIDLPRAWAFGQVQIQSTRLFFAGAQPSEDRRFSTFAWPDHPKMNVEATGHQLNFS